MSTIIIFMFLGMMTEILAYLFIVFFVVIPSFFKLKTCLLKYENPPENDSASQLTLRVPENGGVE